jgi:hypothetical protein
VRERERTKQARTQGRKTDRVSQRPGCLRRVAIAAVVLCGRLAGVLLILVVVLVV